MSKDNSELTTKKLIERLEKSEHDLQERIKELNCLYGISKLADERELSIEDVLESVVVDLIPPAMQYPDITVGRIKFSGKSYTTPGFKETRWKLEHSITVAGKPFTLEVFYLQDMPFLENFEPSLIKDIANRLQVIIENREETKQMLLDARVKALVELNEQLQERMLERGNLSDIDLVDKQIIQLLTQDGRMKLVDIGDQLSVKGKQGYSHVGVKNRISKLIDSDTMRIQATVNLKKFNAVIGIQMIQTNTPKDEATIIEDFEDCPRILFSFKTLGKYNLVYGILAETIENLQIFVHESSPATKEGVLESFTMVSSAFLSPKFMPTKYFDLDTSDCQNFKKGLCHGCPTMMEKYKE